MWRSWNSPSGLVSFPRPQRDVCRSFVFVSQNCTRWQSRRGREGEGSARIIIAGRVPSQLVFGGKCCGRGRRTKRMGGHEAMGRDRARNSSPQLFAKPAGTMRKHSRPMTHQECQKLILSRCQQLLPTLQYAILRAEFPSPPYRSRNSLAARSCLPAIIKRDGRQGGRPRGNA